MMREISRWQPRLLLREAQPAPPPPYVNDPAQAEPPRAPTAAEVEAVLATAQAEGHATGYAAGHAEGLAAGRAEAERQAGAEAARWAQLVGSGELALREARLTMAGEVLDFALEVARFMLRETLRVKPALAQAAIAEALESAAPFAPGLTIQVNPVDAELLRERMADALQRLDVNVVEAADIAAGGCRVSSRQCAVDATLPTRWQRLGQLLGRDLDWLSPAGDA